MALADNLVAYYELDEASGNALDSHGSLDLTETSGTIGTATGPGGSGGARDFEAGDTEYFRASGGSSTVFPGDADFSVQVWVNPETVVDNSGIVMCTSGSSLSTPFALYPQSSRYRFFMFNTSGTSVSAVANNFGAPGTAEWHCIHFGFRSSANEGWISVNAGTRDTASFTITPYTGSAVNLDIGQQLGFFYWDGLMAKLAIWHREITTAEQTELYNSGSGRDYAYITGGGGAGAARRAINQRFLATGSYAAQQVQV